MDKLWSCYNVLIQCFWSILEKSKWIQLFGRLNKKSKYKKIKNPNIAVRDEKTAKCDECSDIKMSWLCHVLKVYERFELAEKTKYVLNRNYMKAKEKQRRGWNKDREKEKGRRRKKVKPSPLFAQMRWLDDVWQ